VLLYAVMTSTIILAVGVSIISIALKQLSISTLGRESQYAFYAANTGAECALYWDFHGVLKNVAGTTDGPAYERLAVFENPFLSPNPIDGAQREVAAEEDKAEVRCAQPDPDLGVSNSLMANIDPAGNPSGAMGADVNDSWYEPGCSDTACSTTFTVFLGRDANGAVDPDGPCARVTVEKVRGSSSGGSFSPSSTGANMETTVDSRGYNYCSGENTRRVERGLRFTY